MLPWIVAPLALLAEAPPQQSAILLDEYVVEARHFETGILQVPADVVRINRERIERSLARSVPDLLQSEANLLFNTVSGSTSVAMRGFGENSSLRSLIIVDGQPLNPADMGRINWEQIPLDSIESVEVLRGGQNVLYGDKALAGVIKIETRRSGKRSAEASVRSGSFDTTAGSFTASGGAGNWSARGGFFRKTSEGYRENSSSEAMNLYAAIGYTAETIGDLDLRINYSENENRFPGGLIFETFQQNPRSSSNLGDQGTATEAVTTTARFHGSHDTLTWEALLGVDATETNWTFGSGSFGQNNQRGLSLKPRGRFQSDTWTAVAGFDVLHDQLDFERFLDEAKTLRPAEAELEETRISPYFLIEKELTARISVSGGARYEQVFFQADAIRYERDQLSPFIQTDFGPFSNPDFKNPPDIEQQVNVNKREQGAAAELSVNFKINETTSLWAGYDRVYRYPVFDERAAYQGFPLAEDVNLALEAEEGNNFEIGLKHLKGRHAFFMTAFLLRMENEIIFDPNAEGSNSFSTGLNINLGPVERRGVDAAYEYKGNRWGASTRLALVDTEIQSGEGRGQEVPLVPNIHTSSQLWLTPVEALRLSLTHRYVGGRQQGGDFTNTLRTLNSYHVVDVGIDAQITPHFRVFAAIDNAFDTLYAEGAFLGAYYPGNGRSFTVGAHLKF